MKGLKDLYHEIYTALDELSSQKKLLLIVLVWGLIFLPTSIYYSQAHTSSQLAFYPEDSSNIQTTQGDWDVRTGPVPLNRSADGRLLLSVNESETVQFTWMAENYTAMVHIGRINVYYEGSWGGDGFVRLSRRGADEGWRGNKTFRHNGTISYYYRLDKGDIPRFDKRARAIVLGENLYESVRTGPPPLVNFYFIPPMLLAPSLASGGFFLSFYMYFSLFLLLDGILLYLSFRSKDETKALLTSVLFMANPIAIYSIFQDEGIIAFTVILSIFLLAKGRKKLASIFIGAGLITKVWSGFLLPIQMFYKRSRKLRNLYYMVLSAATAGGLLLFFYNLWGDKVLWFITFYGGTASKSNLGGVSIWARLTSLPSVSLGLDTIFIVGALGIMELAILLWGYRRGWEPLRLLTVTLSLFLVLYPKIHWEYYLILYPVLLFYVVRDKRFFLIFLGNVLFLSISRGIRNHLAYPAPWTTATAFIASLLSLLLIAWMVYIFLTDKDVPDIDIPVSNG